MANTPDERLARLLGAIRQNPALAEDLPSTERTILDAALDGQPVYAIAQDQGISDEAVWSILSNAARASAGLTPAHPVETGGLGSDTDPGVQGGYGDTGFGSLGLDPPEPIPEEPSGTV